VAINIQYNKTSLQGLEKQLKVRERALPTLKNKESALRMEVKRARDKATSLDEELFGQIQQYTRMSRLWGEFDHDLIRIRDVKLSAKKIAGVFTPILEDIQFETGRISAFNQPVWYADGVGIVRKLTGIAVEREVFLKKMELLDFARKKTTQKVNLYEKVQIPGFQDAIRKIKRFLEDEDNLSKSAQKIVKNRQQKQRLEEEES
jgi:V/A-type H+/Na+-transporting ATPase subunit D